jgi:hypothetical protein
VGRSVDFALSTGRFLHALANVKKSQGYMDESHELHKRALSQYLSTIGRNHHRTGDVHVKVAEHCLRAGDLTAAGLVLRLFGVEVDIDSAMTGTTSRKPWGYLPIETIFARNTVGRCSKAPSGWLVPATWRELASRRSRVCKFIVN